MNIASVADVKAKLSAYLDACADRPVVVTRNGKAVAVLVGVEDDDDLELLLLSRSKKLREILDAGERQISEGKGIPHDEFWRQVEERNQKKPTKPARKKRAAKRSA